MVQTFWTIKYDAIWFEPGIKIVALELGQRRYLNMAFEDPYFASGIKQLKYIRITKKNIHITFCYNL
jgi:hypothetical protein